MKFNTIKIYLLAVLPLLSCNTISELKLQSDADSTISVETTIPFRYTKKLIVVDAHLNNSKTTNSFIFDTGAFQSKVEYQLSQELKLNTITKRNNGTAQGVKREIEITTVDSIKISKSKFYNISAGKLKYDQKSYSPCIAEDGIIGANLIKLAHWKIDYQKKEMLVSQKSILPNTNNEQFDIEFDTSLLSGIPKIDIEINGQIIKDVIFDLGYNGGLVVPYRFAEKFHSTKTQTIIDQSTAGIFGSNRDTLLVKQLNVKIGNLKTIISVEFSSLNKALLGNDFLEHFKVYIDYNDDKIILESVEPMAIDKPKTFIPGILNDSLWIVNRTNPKLPLKIGDTLKTINGYQPKDLFASHCDYFLEVSQLLASKVLFIETKQGKEIKIKSFK
ncbi:aspartyl protease family protein [Aquimarina algiphila]|uniref:aspartyl protease family protein n=1 Tax=Aquimarina algiphila TaxID=2047982 RepID=UPI002330C024|nr:aspartyl protease family protein [Aquimarina algiphila]